MQLELLSPAKNCDQGREAINHGADAVYIGAPLFGARVAAGNSLADIEALARYAHLYHAKVFATVNTLLFDEEVPKAVELLHQLYNAGVDAAIIQDLGLLECLQLHGGLLSQRPHLLQGGLAGQYHTTETYLFHEFYAFDSGVVGLCAGM